MRALLDHNVNPRYARLLPEHQVTHTYKLGWAELLNGDLIAAAEQEGFDAIITADKSMQYQQTITSRKIAIIVFKRTAHHLAAHRTLGPPGERGFGPASPRRFFHKPRVSARCFRPLKKSLTRRGNTPGTWD